MNPHSTPHSTEPLGSSAEGFPPGGVADLATRDPREHLEPGENQRQLSLIFVIFLGSFFAWGGYYLHRFSAGYDPYVYSDNAYGLVLSKTNATEKVDPYVLGKRVYENTCAKCHQSDGQGLPGQYPPLAGSEWVLAAGPARMIRIVLDAVQGPIQVKGATYDNTMTPWRDTLNDEQIAAVITYARTQKEWKHTASAVTPEEVAAIRAKTKARAAAGPWHVDELKAIPEQEPAQ